MAAIETALVGRVLAHFTLPVDTVLYDATNFFTFLATTTARATLPARGHSKQKRHDLRPVGVALGGGLEGITVVSDKGNVGKHTQATVGAAPFHYIGALTAASQRALIAEATPHLTPLALNPEETVPVYRARRLMWGAERTLVVLVSARLQQGQHLREILNVRLHGRGRTRTLTDTVDLAALDRLEREWFGRLVP